MTRKRGNGDGSIYQTTSGEWIARISVKGLDGKRRRRQRKAKTRALAALLLDELKSESKAAPLAAGPRLMVQDFLSKWLWDVVRVTKEHATYVNYRTMIERHINPHVGVIYLENLSASKIETWLSALLDAGVGGRSRQNSFAVLSTAMEHAASIKRLIPENPCSSVGRPAHIRQEIYPFTAQETATILGAVKGKRLAGVCELGLRLGLRQGELFGLQWQDLNAEARTISIQRQACEVSGIIALKPPKTKNSVRMLELDDSCVDALHERRAAAMREGLAACPLIFPGRDGSPMHRSNFGARHWKPLLLKLEFDHRGFHHCRHTAATLMLSHGVAVHTVSRILGHSKPSVTLDIYAHYVRTDSRGATEALSRALKAAT